MRRGKKQMEETKKRNSNDKGGRSAGKKNWIILAVFAVLAVCFLVWAFYPRNFDEITGVEITEGVQIRCNVQSDPFVEDYRFKELSASREIGDVVSILTSSDYRKDIRYPFSNSATSTQAYDGRNMMLDFYDSEAGRYICYLHLIDAGLVEIVTYETADGGEKVRTYTPTDSEMFDSLYEYLDDMAV